MTYDYAPLPYEPPAGLTEPEPRHAVAIVGAGPVGLALAIDLAQRGVASVVLDDNNVVSVGSRAICWAKRSLEIFDRLGVGEQMLRSGVTWKIGRQFHGAEQLYAFDLLPEKGHKFPAFVNLQQYYVEHYLIERASRFPDLIDLRFLNNVVRHHDHQDHIVLSIETPDGPYEIEAEWLIACDGANSPTRRRMDLSFEGETFEENFLIIDVEMEKSPFGNDDTPERWFWFAPPFHEGQSALLHKQPDNIYRIDLQLGSNADPQTEAQEENVISRIRAIVGDTPFRLDWTSVYRFKCARLDRFVHNRVVFAGDSAHVVSPFGARGGNGGIQDIDNLGWKLAAVLFDDSPDSLLQSYDDERRFACDENLKNSTRATNFMTPKSAIETLFREEVLRLARRHSFARKLINSGRLSRPSVLSRSLLNGPSEGPLVSGTPIPDAPLQSENGDCSLVEVVPPEFCMLRVGDAPIPPLCQLPRLGIGHVADYPCFRDIGGWAARRFGTQHTYLLRPDGHVCASFKTPSETDISSALARAKGISYGS